MRYNLSTLLFVTALLAISVGWIVDRMQLSERIVAMEKDRADRELQIYIGAGTSESNSQVCKILNRFEFDIPNKRQYIKQVALGMFLELYRNQTSVELAASAIGAEANANFEAWEPLELLECESTEDFFRIARSLPGYDLASVHPEIHNANSPEFKALQQFVADSMIELKRMLGDDPESNTKE